MCYYGSIYVLYSSHWIKGARNKLERSKVALEEEVAARDKEMRELTIKLALRIGDLDKKEVKRELLYYNENCHGSLQSVLSLALAIFCLCRKSCLPQRRIYWTHKQQLKREHLWSQY